MTKEEAKQWLRIQIDSSILIQDSIDKNRYYLSYNKQYLRVLKLSKITGKPVNKENFKSGEKLFGINSKFKTFWFYYKISEYLIDNCSKNNSERNEILEEVINEYDEYKGYVVC